MDAGSWMEDAGWTDARRLATGSAVRVSRFSDSRESARPNSAQARPPPRAGRRESWDPTRVATLRPDVPTQPKCEKRKQIRNRENRSVNRGTTRYHTYSFTKARRKGRVYRTDRKRNTPVTGNTAVRANLHHYLSPQRVLGSRRRPRRGLYFICRWWWSSSSRGRRQHHARVERGRRHHSKVPRAPPLLARDLATPVQVNLGHHPPYAVLALAVLVAQVGLQLSNRRRLVPLFAQMSKDRVRKDMAEVPSGGQPSRRRRWWLVHG